MNKKLYPTTETLWSLQANCKHSDRRVAGFIGAEDIAGYGKD
jgi:hypothetical protein